MRNYNMEREPTIPPTGVETIHVLTADFEYCLALRGAMLHWVDDLYRLAQANCGHTGRVRLMKYSSEALFVLTTKQSFPNESAQEMRWLTPIPGGHHVIGKDGVKWPF